MFPAKPDARHFFSLPTQILLRQNKKTMNIIYMLLGISVVVAVIFFVAFLVSVKKGQYDDVYTPAVRMLFEDELVKPNQTKDQPTSKEKSN